MCRVALLLPHILHVFGQPGHSHHHPLCHVHGLSQCGPRVSVRTQDIHGAPQTGMTNTSCETFKYLFAAI